MKISDKINILSPKTVGEENEIQYFIPAKKEVGTYILRMNLGADYNYQYPRDFYAVAVEDEQTAWEVELPPVHEFEALILTILPELMWEKKLKIKEGITEMSFAGDKLDPCVYLYVEYRSLPGYNCKRPEHEYDKWLLCKNRANKPEILSEKLHGGIITPKMCLKKSFYNCEDQQFAWSILKIAMKNLQKLIDVV